VTEPCPLIFDPIFKPKIWGGRKLHELGIKHLEPNARIGESWELADLDDDQSIVTAGPAQGRTLAQLVADWGSDLLGDAETIDGRFPLLIKFLDAREKLSVQVHPTAETAARAGDNVRTKDEAWYIIDAEPDACMYRGLRPGVTEAALRDSLKSGDCVSLLNRIPLRSGQCYFLPGGTVHALGGGVVLAEVQTPSDSTYRLFDWNRIEDTTGQPRTLHIDEALACIRFDDRFADYEKRSHVASVWTTVTRLITSPSFIVERVKMIDGLEQAIPYAQLVVWMVLEGRGTIRWGGSDQTLGFARGDTVVLPTGLKDPHLTTHDRCTWLEITIPT